MSHLKALLLIVPFSLLVIFCGVTTRQLLDSSEGRLACVAQEMLDGDDWIVPHLNGEIRKEKPAFSSWCVALTTKICGQNTVKAVHAFIPPGLAALGLILLAYAWSSSVSGATGTNAGNLSASPSRFAMLAAILLIASPGFLLQARSAELDMHLALFVALTYWGFYTFRTCEYRPALWVAYVALALGILTKAHVALVMTVPALVLWFFWERQRGALAFSGAKKSSLRIAHGIGIALMLALIVPYAILFIQQSGITWADFNREGGTARFDDTKTGHIESWYWYFEMIPGWFMPWFLLLPISIWANFHQPPDERSPLRRLCWLWFGVNFLIFSLLAAKQRHYAVPFFFPLAILIADGIERTLTHPQEAWRKAMRWTLAGIFLLLAVASMLLPYFLHSWDTLETMALLNTSVFHQITIFTALPFLVVAGYWILNKEIVSIGFGAWWIGLVGVVLLRIVSIETHQLIKEGPEPFCKEVRHYVPADAKLYDYDVAFANNVYRAQVLFYLQHKVIRNDKPLAELASRTKEPLYILASEKHLNTLSKDRYILLADEKKFLGHKSNVSLILLK